MSDRKQWLVGLAKDWGIALAVAVAVFAVWTLFSPKPLSQGPAPEFTLVDVDGNEVSLSDFRGQTVVINYWATWCGPCVSEIPELAAFHEARPDVAFLGISLDERLTPGALEVKARRMGVNYPILMDADGSVSLAYHVNTLPTTFVIDAEGQIDDVRVGTVSRKRLERMVE